MVEAIVELLQHHGILDNTYLIYTSDNGYHIGQHRLPPGKECGYEEDVNVPLIVRGPGIPRGAVTDQVTSHTDIVPTIFDLLGLDARDDFDGVAIPLTTSDMVYGGHSRHEHITLEYWGFALAEGRYGFQGDSGSDPKGKISGSCLQSSEETTIEAEMIEQQVFSGIIPTKPFDLSQMTIIYTTQSGVPTSMSFMIST